MLTTVNHLNNDVWELTAVNAAGHREQLRPTGFHKFYSETRGDWVSTKEIHDNEIIRGRAGPLTIVASQPLPGTSRVYNLTVEGEHVYYVSELGLLAHNNCDIPRFRSPGHVDLTEFKRLNVADPAVGHIRPGEASAAVEIQSHIGRLERSNSANLDFVVVSGKNKGKSVDFFFTAESPSQVANLNKYFTKNLSGNQRGILNHLNKADIVPLDFRNLNSANQGVVLNFLQNLPRELRTKALIIE